MQSAPKRILIVDDDPDILEFLRLVVEEEGYVVMTSLSGEPLEHLPHGELPDLIVSDVMLSGTDGRSLVKTLKSQEETKTIPVILMSAYHSAAETARQAGADDFLAKPFSLDGFLTKIAQSL